MAKTFAEGALSAPLAALMLIASAVLLQAVPAAAEDLHKARVVIMSPSDGASVKGGQVDVIIEMRGKGRHVGRVSLYIDGRLVRPLYGKRVSYTFTGLKKGRHTITVKRAVRGHSVIETEDSVTVKVR